jgi:biotin-dependent carboxylase-like uncharacterized protein
MMRVIKPGALSTLQDLGRYGYQRIGVPVNGAMDEWSHRVGNLLVGNPDEAVSLEITLTGPSLRFERDSLIAMTGADLRASLNGVPLPRNRAVLVRAGALLACGDRQEGARAYLAVRGGFQADTLMGSGSTFLRGGFGGMQGRALQKGDRVAVGSDAKRPTALIRIMVQSGSDMVIGPVLAQPWEPVPQAAEALEGEADGAANPEGVVLRCMPGPQWDRFEEDARKRFEDSAFRIDGRSDRMGYRLQGPTLLLKKPLEMVSEATPFGTVQVPPDGNPIVLMADRQSAGGYPKIAYVATVDLPRLAQSMPGESVAFLCITLEESQSLYLRREAALEALRAEVLAAAPSLDD